MSLPGESGSLEPNLEVTTAPSVVSGGLWTLLSQVLPQLQLVALSIITARYLGPDDMGRQSYIAFVSLALVLAATAGLPHSLTRFIGELLGAGAGGHAMSLYRMTRRIEGAAAALVLGVLAAVAALGGDPQAAWVLAGLSGALHVLQTVPQSLLSGAQRWRETTIPSLVTGSVMIPVAILVFELGGGITGIFAAEAATVFANLLWTTALARRIEVRLPPATPVPGELQRRFLSFAGSTTLITMIHLVVWRRSELFVLESVSSDAEIAFYSIAFATVSGLAKLPEAIETVAMPAVANLVGTGEQDRIRRGFWRAIRILSLLVPPLVAGVAVTGPALLRLIYGEQYAGAGDVLLVMLAPLLIQPILTLSMAVLYGLGRPRFIVGAGLVATVVDLALALFLIPRLDAVGAAIANGVAQLVAGVPCLVLAIRLHRPAVFSAGAVLRGLGLGLVVAAGSGAVLIALGTGGLATVTAVLAGALAVLFVAMLLRPVEADDARWLAGALGSTGARGQAGRFVLRLAPAERP